MPSNIRTKKAKKTDGDALKVAGSSATKNEVVYELQFRELFTGEMAVISIDGNEYKKLTLTTRLQTGLAHIETISIMAGQELTISLPELKISKGYKTTGENTFISIDLKEQKIEITGSPQTHGYV